MQNKKSLHIKNVKNISKHRCTMTTKIISLHMKTNLKCDYENNL